MRAALHLASTALETRALIWHVSLTAASVHDSREFENVVRGDKAMVVAALFARRRVEL